MSNSLDRPDPPNLVAALSYIGRGWYVFPVPPGLKCGYRVEKRGHDNGRPWGKTRDQGEARGYWGPRTGRPGARANVGVAMGQGSGIFDLEADTPEGHDVDGLASIAKLEEERGVLPPTLTFESPTGSVHRIYAHPGGDVRIRLGALDPEKYPGVDVKGEGGMSVMPPSVSPRRGMYRWTNDLPVAEAPPWLVSLVRKVERLPRVQTSSVEANLARVTLALAMIPNEDLEWHDWNRVGLATWAATEGSDQGLRAFDAWCQKSMKHGVRESTRATWDRITRCPPDDIGAGTIFYLANEAVPDWEDRLDDRDVDQLVDQFLILMGERESE